MSNHTPPDLIPASQLTSTAPPPPPMAAPTNGVAGQPRASPLPDLTSANLPGMEPPRRETTPVDDNEASVEEARVPF